MNTETMTLHKALTELKTIDARITKQIHSAKFCAPKKNREKNIGNTSPQTFAENAKSSYQSILDLISRRNAIKAAVAKSNAVTTVKVAGKEYSVTEAIALKQHGMELYTELVNEITSQYAQADRAVALANAGLDASADQYIATLYGGEKAVKNVDSAEVAATRASYIEGLTTVLVDGLAGKNTTLETVCSDLQKRIDDFHNEVDAALSVSNATTTITIAY